MQETGKIMPTTFANAPAFTLADTGAPRMGAAVANSPETPEALARHLGLENERLAGRLQHLLQALPAGVVVLDGAGIVRECNRAARALLGEPLQNQYWSAVIERAFA